MPDEKQLRKRSYVPGVETSKKGGSESVPDRHTRFETTTSRALEAGGVQRMPQSFAPMGGSPMGGLDNSHYRYFPGASAAPVDSPAARMMSATTQINPLIARAEKALASLGFNVTASVPLEHEPAQQWSRHLRFGKEGKEWCLTVESGLDGDESDNWTSVRLPTASREIRLRALQMLPDLVEALSGQADKQSREALKIVEDAQAFIMSLEGVDK